MNHHAAFLGNIEQNTLLIDIATRNVVRLASDDSVGAAARIMAEKRISSIVVTDAAGHPTGIVTERNMLQAMQSGCPPETALYKVMSAPVITVPGSMTCLDAYQICLRDGIRHLVIVNEDKLLLGMVSETDFRLHVNLSTLAGHRQVAAVMNPSVFSLRPDASLQDALDLMQSHRDSCAVVVEDERPTGIITERDIVRLYSANQKLGGISVKEVMTAPVLSIPLGNTINEAARRMLASRVRHLVVVDQAGRMAGLLSEHELTHAMTLGLIDSKTNAESAFLHTLVNTIPDMVWLKDVDGVYLACNPRFERYFGVPEKDIVGKTDADFVGEEQAEFCRAQDRQAMLQDTPSVNEEWITYADDGHRELLETIKTPMRDSQGKLTGVLSIARDITGRRQLEDRLEASEKKFHNIFESVSDGIELISIDGRIVDLSRVGHEMLGYAKEEMVGHRLAEFASPEFAAIVSERMALIIRRGHATFESARLHRNGKVIPIEVSSRLVELDGQPVFLGISRDITERKEMEAALADSESRYRTLVENSPFCIHEIDLHGRLQSMNHAGLDMMGLDDEKKICGVPYLSAVSEQDGGRIRALLQDAIDGTASHFEFAAAGNTPLYFKSCFIPIKDAGGKVLKLMGLTEDITGRKRLEQELNERGEVFRAIFEQAPNGVELIDPETLHFVEANPAACRMLGYTHEEFLRLRLTDTQADWNEPGLIAAVQGVEASGGATFENRHRCKNGDILDVEVTSRMLNVSGKRLLVAVWRDITERKRIEEERRKLSAALMQSGEAVALIDTESRYVYSNPAFCQLFGYGPEELIGNSVNILMPPEDISGPTARQTVAAALGHGAFRGEVRRRAKDGKIVPILLKVAPFRDERDVLIGYVASMTDLTEIKRMEDALRASEKHFRDIMEQAPLGTITTTLDGRFIEVNQAFCDIVGYPKEALKNLSFGAITHPDDIGISLENIHKLIAGEIDSYRIEKRYFHRDGHALWAQVDTSLRRDQSGQPLCLICQIRDITVQKHAEDALRITASVFDNSQEAILITDANNHIVDVNHAFSLITGYDREEVLGRNPKLLCSGRHDRAFYAAMWRSLKQEKAWRGEIWNRRKSGEIYAELLSISAICDGNGKVQRYVGVFSDISHLKEHEAELSRVAHYDALTGIPNRVLLADRMKQAIAQTAREQNMLAVCYLDLDGFKPINDTLGHEAGDQVLIEISRRIGHTIRGGDTVARLGGDEFVVLLLGLERGEECVATLERLLAVIAQPITVAGQPQTLSASVGVSIYPLDDEDPDTLLRHADQAMYVAKQSGKNRYYIYDAALDQRARNRHEFMQNVRYSLRQGEFELYYQPKVNLATQQLVGVEALIRWRHSERGLLAPGEFLRPIENTDLDIEVGEWVIATALDQIKRWHEAGLDLEVSINISAYHLESAHFAEKLRQQLALCPGLPPGSLQIEVLETVALNDIAIVREVVDACRSFGVRFALDDFGTGYSSLSYLSSLPIDVVKIDQSFVRDMLDDRGDKAIVQGIIALARAFERQTVAEGIETAAHCRALLDMGCEIGQGYEIARPMPADELVSWQANRKGCL